MTISGVIVVIVLGLYVFWRLYGEHGHIMPCETNGTVRLVLGCGLVFVLLPLLAYAVWP